VEVAAVTQDDEGEIGVEAYSPDYADATNKAKQLTEKF
jgi:hypothetical protein